MHTWQGNERELLMEQNYWPSLLRVCRGERRTETRDRQTAEDLRGWKQSRLQEFLYMHVISNLKGSSCAYASHLCHQCVTQTQRVQAHLITVWYALPTTLLQKFQTFHPSAKMQKIAKVTLVLPIFSEKRKCCFVKTSLSSGGKLTSWWKKLKGNYDIIS